MATYYDGDLDADLAALSESLDSAAAEQLDRIGRGIGYGRAQQIIQILWAKMLREKGLPTSGALGH